MGDHEVAVELDEDRVVALDLSLKVISELGEHLLENGQFNVVVHGEDLNGDGLVDGQDLLDGRAVVSDHGASSFLELTLLEVSLGEFHEVSVEDFLALLLGKAKALIPLAALSEHLKALEVSLADHAASIVSLDEESLLLLLNLEDNLVLELDGADLTSTVKCSLPVLVLDIGFDGLLEEVGFFKHLGGLVEFLDLNHATGEEGHNMRDTVLSVVHGKIETVSPHLHKVVRWEHVLSDLEVAVNGLVEIAAFLPDLGGIKDLFGGLVLD
mmetsp:Transcript_37056/g.56827  ORF Transcript_37056/g.56827 Transcript_37056/m.56827 type:complete len:269 (-) Transcript_37056:3756-4562(-)